VANPLDVSTGLIKPQGIDPRGVPPTPLRLAGVPRGLLGEPWTCRKHIACGTPAYLLHHCAAPNTTMPLASRVVWLIQISSSDKDAGPGRRGPRRLTDCSHLQENPDGRCSDGADYHPEHPVS
jgi:hypothetical protein